MHKNQRNNQSNEKEKEQFDDFINLKLKKEMLNLFFCFALFCVYICVCGFEVFGFVCRYPLEN